MIRSIFERPKAVYTVLVVLLVGLFALSFVGNTMPAEEKPTSGPEYVIGGIGWFGFLITFLIIVLFTAALGVRRLLRRRISA